MISEPSEPSKALRAEAQQRLRHSGGVVSRYTPDDFTELLHEYQVHQVELEIQNEELRRVQLEIEAARDRFEDLYNLSPVAHMTVDAKGMIVAGNLTAAELLGVSSQQLTSSFFSSYIVSASSDSLFLFYKQLRESDGNRCTELRINAGGGVRVIRLNGMRVVEGESCELRLALTDVTEQREAERRQLALEKKLEETNRFKILGAFTGGVAHDFKNLLAPILIEADLVSMAVHDDPRSERSLAVIVKAALSASDLCRQMLEYTGSGEAEFAELDLYEMIVDFLSVLNSIVPESVKLVLEKSERLSSINGDQEQLQRIMLNLVKNAVEAIGSKSGKIRIFVSMQSLSSDQIEPMALVGDASVSEFVSIEVSDDGCGLEQSAIPRIFDPFYSSKRAGRGLGMAAVVGIATSHRASIAVESELDAGTTVRLYFPVKASLAEGLA